MPDLSPTPAMLADIRRQPAVLDALRARGAEFGAIGAERLRPGPGGAKSGASKDVPADSVLFGMIGEPIQQARANLVNVRRLPKLIQKLKKLEAELAELKVLAATESGRGRQIFGNPDVDAASAEA